MPPINDLSPRADVMRAFLDAGFGHVSEPGLIEIAYSGSDGGAITRARLFENTPEGRREAAEHAARVNAEPGVNCYLAPSLRKLDTQRDKRAKKVNVLGAPMVWADCDAPGAADAAKAIYEAKGAAPHLAVVTGREPAKRAQLFWLLDGLVTDQGQLDEMLAGVHVGLDFVADPKVVNADRVMRLPGSVSWPKPGKEGRVPEVTELLKPGAAPAAPYAIGRVREVFPPRNPVAARKGGDVAPGGDLLAHTAPVAGKAGLPATPAPAAAVAPASASPIAPEPEFDMLGRRINGRDEYAMNVIGGTIRNLTGKFGRWPTGAEIAADAWPTFERQCAPKNPAGTLEAEGRGWTWFAEKCATHARRAAGGQIAGMETVEKAIAGAVAQAGLVSPPAAHAIFPNGFRLQSSAEFVADYTPPDYLIDGNLRRGWLYTLTAPTGHGKTAAMLTLAHCIATGAEFCGSEVSQGAVLYLAGENPDDVQARYIGLLDYRHDDAAGLPILFHGGTFSIRRDFDAMRAAIEAAGRQLAIVVVDTLAAYFDGDDLNSNAQQQEFATNVLRPLTTLPGRPCVVVPAHPVKNAAKNNLVPMGGSALLNQVDGNMTAWNEGGVVSLHWQGKFRGAAWEPMQLELVGHTTPKLMDSKGRCIPTVVANEVTVTRAIDLSAQHEGRENRALAFLDRYPKSTIDGLAGELGCAKSTAHALYGRLVEAKWIKREGRSTKLTSEGRGVLDGEI